MKTILLPTDFSKNAWNSLFTAFKLFQNEGYRFLLLNTYEPDLINVLGDHGEKRLGLIYESLEAESKAQMKALLTEIDTLALHDKFEIKTRCVPGDLIAEVKKLVKKGRVDFIVLGTKGATGAQRVFMGSNTVRMITHISNRPVLAVPRAYDFQKLRKVVFPTDFMHYNEPFELQGLLDLIDLWNAELHMVYAAKEFRLNPTQESNKNLLKSQLEGRKLKIVEVPLETNVTEAIQTYAHTVQADLIALMQHKHSFLEALTKEKVVKRIAFDTQIPLLVLPKYL
jgi:nucleotide-binding universal stress UspA family protein